MPVWHWMWDLVTSLQICLLLVNVKRSQKNFHRPWPRVALCNSHAALRAAALSASSWITSVDSSPSGGVCSQVTISAHQHGFCALPGLWWTVKSNSSSNVDQVLMNLSHLKHNDRYTHQICWPLGRGTAWLWPKQWPDTNLVAGQFFPVCDRASEVQQMICSCTHCTCTKIAPKPRVEALVYSQIDKSKSGKAVIGALVSRCLSCTKAFWHARAQ